MSAITGLIIASFMFTSDGTLHGTTSNQIPFRQYQIMDSPRVQVFELNHNPLWVIVNGKIYQL